MIGSVTVPARWTAADGGQGPRRLSRTLREMCLPADLTLRPIVDAASARQPKVEITIAEVDLGRKNSRRPLEPRDKLANVPAQLCAVAIES
ncbi:MAG: hypothetical protein K0S70_2689 [Microbacterium sp.]|nr:hypothetical protein [Microbacterium sp.]